MMLSGKAINFLIKFGAIVFSRKSSPTAISGYYMEE
jgi:hypothetical protein